MASQTIEKKEPSEVTRTEQTRGGRHYRPNVDIIENSRELLLLADMPGVAKDHIDIDFEQGILTIHGRVESREREGLAALWREYGVGDFHRTFQVGEAVDAGKITAEYADGVLTLHLPKVEAARARKISVKSK